MPSQWAQLPPRDYCSFWWVSDEQRLNDFYAVTQNWAFRFSVTTWGWLHLLGGIVVLPTGVGLFTGSVLARTVAVIVAMISIVLSFLWLPYYPWWSVLIIAFDFVVIWALTLPTLPIPSTHLDAN